MDINRPTSLQFQAHRNDAAASHRTLAEMTKEELRKSNRSYDIAAAMAFGYLGAFVTGLLWILLGVFSGVIGICSRSSESWSNTYNRLLLLVPVAGILTGCMVGRFYSKKRRSETDPD